MYLSFAWNWSHGSFPPLLARGVVLVESHIHAWFTFGSRDWGIVWLGLRGGADGGYTRTAVEMTLCMEGKLQCCVDGKAKPVTNPRGNWDGYIDGYTSHSTQLKLDNAFQHTD